MYRHATKLPELDAYGQHVAELLASVRRAHAAGALLRLSIAHPQAITALSTAGFTDLQAMTEGLIDHLIQAVSVRRPALYAQQVGWWKLALAARDVDVKAFRQLLLALRDELADEMPADAAAALAPITEAGIAHFDSAPIRTVSQLDDVAGASESERALLDLSRRYLLAALEGRKADAIRLVEGALERGIGMRDLDSKVLGRAQVELGRMWQVGEIYIAEEHLASRITEQVMAAVHARVPRKASNGKRVLVTSPSGDLHDIGLRMVADHFEAEGWDVVFLGADTPSEDVARAVSDFAIDLVAIAAKLVLHVRATAELIHAVREATPDRRPPILVGGPPFQLVPDLWQIVGADGVAAGATDAVAVGERLTTPVA